MMIFAFSELCSISVLANRISLVKYNVLIKKVPKPIATTKTTVWLLGLNKFNKLCLSVKPQRFGKYRLIALIQSKAIPANTANVKSVATTKPKAYKILSSSQNENKKRNAKMAVNTNSRTFNGSCDACSSTRNTSSGDTYQVLSKGNKANSTDINSPKNTPINIGWAEIEISTEKGKKSFKIYGNNS